MSTKHAIAAARFLENKENEAWHDHTLWMVRTKRDKMSHSLPEWERLRELASEIKLYSNSHLDTLLEEFEKNAIANGAIVHWAKDAEEHNEIVLRILRQHDARNLIKSKSMLTEECHMNEFLMSKGIDVVESDLGERILQLMHLAPSHIVMPAIHIKREQISEMMEREMGTEKGNIDPTYLTHAARKNLREKFLHADVAMTGANFAVASTGEIVVCTNEGNADMGTSSPKVRISLRWGWRRSYRIWRHWAYSLVCWLVRVRGNPSRLILPIIVVRPRDKSSISLSWITGVVISWRNRIIFVR